jgi:hypothetical protein
MIRSGLLALAVGLGLTSAVVRAQPPLAWKFEKGDSFRLQTVSTVKQTLRLLKEGKPEGREVKQDMEYQIVMAYKVLDKTKDQVVLENKVESMSFKNPDGAITADQKVAGAVFQITLDAKGDVTKLDGYDEFLKKLAGDDGNTLKTLQAVLPKEALMRSAKEAFGFLPEKPAKTWTRELTIPMGPLGTLQLKNSYKHEGNETVAGKGLEKITFDSAVTYTAPKAQTGAVPFRVEKGDLKAEPTKGTIHFDQAAGRLVSLQHQIKLKGAVSLVSSGTKIDAELDQDQTTKTTLIPEKK